MLPMAVKPEANLVVFGMLASTMVLGLFILSRVEQLRPLVAAPVRVNGYSFTEGSYPLSQGDVKAETHFTKGTGIQSMDRAIPIAGAVEEVATPRRESARSSLTAITLASLVSVIVSGIGAAFSGVALFRSTLPETPSARSLSILGRDAEGRMATSAREPIQPISPFPTTSPIQHLVTRGTRTTGFNLDLGDDEEALDRQFIQKGRP